MALGGSVAGVARVIVEADNRRLGPSLKQSERQVEGFATRGRVALAGFVKQFAQLGAVGGVAGLALVLKSSIDAASNLNEEITKSQQVFGRSAAEMLRWSKTADTAFGLSERAALQGAGAVGNMLRTVGVLGPELGKMSRDLVELAGDLASFNNEDPSDMLDRLRSGLAGEAEPLRRFGILLSEARVAQEAVNMGLVTQGTKLTEQEKVLARYSLILKDSVTAQGDFGRTSGGLANQQRILRAALENLQATLGKQLLPIQIAVTKQLVAWATALQHNKQLQDDIKGAIEGVVDTTKSAVVIIDDIVDAMGGWKNASQFIIAGTLYTKVLVLSKAFTVLAGSEAAAGAAAGGGAAVGIGGAAARAATLLRTLRAISAIGTIVIAFKIKTEGWDAIPKWLIPPGQFGRPYEPGDEVPPWLVGTEWDPNFAPGPKKPVAPPGGYTPGTRPRNIPQGGVQVPTSQRSTHETAGLPGYPAVDYFAKPGTPVRAPENGAVVRHSGHPGTTSGNVYGSSLYYDGYETGNSYFITHLMWVAPLGNYSKGDVIGRVSAWSGGSPHAHIGIHPGAGGRRGGGGAPTAPRGAPRGGVADIVPQSLQLGLAEAEVTKGTADDVRALKAIEAYLEKRLAAEKNVAQRLKLLRELKSVRSQLKSAGGGDRATETLRDLIPPVLEHRLAQAELTKTLDDDLKALQATEAYLVKRLAATKKLTEQTRIMRELKDIRSQMEGILGEIGSDKKAIDKLIGDIVAGTETLVSGPREPGASRVFAPGPNFVERVTTAEGQAEYTKLLASLEPQKQRIRDWATEMNRKRDAARERKKALQAQLKKLRQTPARLRTATWRQAEANLVAAIAELAATIKQLDEGIARAFEMWADLEASETSETQRLAGEDEESRSQPPESGGGGGDFGDVGGGGGEARSAAEVQAEIDRNVTGYLTGTRDLTRGYATNVLAAAFAGGLGANVPLMGGLGGSTITVQNFFQQQPDPHTWSKALEFELKSLVS